MPMRAVSQIKDFHGVTLGQAGNPREAEKLEGVGIRSIDELWSCIAVNFDTGISQVAEKAAVDPELLFALLIADGLGDSRHRVEGAAFGFKSIPKRLWLGLKRLWSAHDRHWLEASLAFATLLLVVLAFRAGYINSRLTEQVVVRSSSRLLPFQRVRADDLLLQPVPQEQGSFTSIQKVVGRYPLRDIAPDSILREDQFVTPELTDVMKDRRVLSLPVNPQTLAPPPAVPGRIWLLLAPRASAEKGPQPVLLKDVILLSIGGGGETSSAEIAVTDEGLKEVGAALGASEAFLLQAGN